MKAKFTVFLFLIAFCACNAQWLTRSRLQNIPSFDKKEITWGYYFGTNFFDFNFDYRDQQKDIQTEKASGFNVGILGDLKLSNYFNLRLEPGLVYASRTLLFPEDSRFNNEGDLTREVNSTYIYIPLLLRFNTKRLNNVRPFVTFGVATAINLSSNEKNPDDNFGGVFRTTRNNIFYDVGIGIDLYLFYFKFTPSIRGVLSIDNELVPDARANSPWTDNLSQIRSRGIFINFTFQ